VLDEQWPPTYMVVYCDAKVEIGRTASGMGLPAITPAIRIMRSIRGCRRRP